MIIFFFSDTAIAVLVIVILIFTAGSLATIAEWIISHMLLLLVLLIAKSLLMLGKTLFVKAQLGLYYFMAGTVILCDAVRSGIFLGYAYKLASNMLGGGIFEFILGGINLVFGVLCGVCAAEGPMYLVYDSIPESGGGLPSPGFCIALEMVSIVALGIAYCIFT